jgi:hypothetical protein
MMEFKKWLLYIPKEIFKFVTYYPCMIISRRIDYFHYRLLTCFSYPIFTINPASGIIGNKCYGSLWAIKNATGTNFHHRCMIEHGLYFGEFVIEDECKLMFIDTIYTFSEYRKNAILNWFGGNLGKEIIPIGPYILSAKHFKSENKLKTLKKELGKILLVFPSHPTHSASTQYDVDEFLKEVDDVAKDYDTILVSLFWLDIRRGNDKPYIQKGYKVVCSGIRSDRWFLSRQKDLLWLADLSMSNDIGTHIGYSVAMGVPHYIFKQKVELVGGGIEYSMDKYNQIRVKEYNEMIEAFGRKATFITDEQVSIVKKYWGQW